MRKYCKVLLCTSKYYKILLQYYSVLQSTKTLLRATKYYSVLQSTTPVLQSIALSYKVLLQRYSSTIPYYSVLQSTAKYSPYYKVRLQYYKVLLQYCKALLHTRQYNRELQSTAKCYPVLAHLIVATHETSNTLRQATCVDSPSP